MFGRRNEEAHSEKRPAAIVLPPANDPAPNKRLPKGVYNNFGFEFFNAIMWQSFGSPVILFARQSGASAFIIGAISAIQLILMPLTLATSRVVERLGYRRVALVCWTLRWMLCGALIPIALLDFPGFEAWRVPLVLAVIFSFHLMRNFGVSANIPWITSIIPAGIRGLYLSRVTMFANIAGIITFLSVGTILGKNPPLSQFAWVFGLGVFGGAFSSIFMSRIQPPPKTVHQVSPKDKPRQTFWAGFKKCFRQPGFKTFVAIQSFYGVAFFGIPSLSLIYLREKVGISPDIILYFSTAGIIGATVAVVFWGRWIDRRGITSLQLLAFSGLCINSALWFATGLLGAYALNLALAALVSFLSSIWISALTMSQTHAIMTLAPDDDRVLFQNIATFMTYCTQSLAPMLWGILIDSLEHNNFKFELGGAEGGAFRLFFLATLVIGLCGVVFLAILTRRELRKERANEPIE